MILRALRVEFFGVLNPGAQIEDIGDAITLLHGPNEIGKSSLLRALTYALYQRHRVSGDEVRREILPIGTSMIPRVEVEFEAGGARWKIAKTFLKKQQSQLSRLADGQFVGCESDEDADARLAELLDSSFAGKGLSKPEHRGIGEVLISDQGSLRAVHEIGDRARGSLRGLLGVVTTTPDAHGLGSRVRKLEAELFTGDGELRKSSRAQQLELQLGELAQQIAMLESELAHVPALEQSLRSAAQAESEASHRLAALRDVVERARITNARRIELEGKRAQIDPQLEVLQRRVNELTAAEVHISEARVEIERLAPTRKHLEQELSELRLTLARHEAELRVAEDAVRSHDAKRDAVEARSALAKDAERAQRCGAEIATITRRLDEYTELQGKLAALQARIAQRSRPDATTYGAIQRKRRDVAEVSAKLDALNMRVRIEALQPLRLLANGVTSELDGAATTQLCGSSPFVIEIVGVARLHVAGPTLEAENELRAALTARTDELAKLSAPFGTDDDEQLTLLVGERNQLDTALAELRGAATGIFSTPQASEDAKGELVARKSELRSLLARRPELHGEAPAKAFVEHIENSAQLQRHEHETRAADLRKHVEERTALKDDLVKRAHGIDERLGELRTKQRGLESRVETLAKARADAERAGEVDEARRVVGECEAAAAHLALQLEPLAHSREELGAAERAVLDFEQSRESKLRAHAEAGTKLDELHKKGLYTRVAALEEQRAELQAEHARAELQAQAARLLARSFAEEEAHSLAAIQAPIAERVRRMALAVLNKDLRLGLTEDMSSVGVRMDERELALEQLSSGTRDQVALFTRIAFAELYAEKHGRQALVLDDPLVHCDSERRRKILEVLARAARSLQIVIFTCREEDYFGLDARRVALG